MWVKGRIMSNCVLNIVYTNYYVSCHLISLGLKPAYDERQKILIVRPNL